MNAATLVALESFPALLEQHFMAIPAGCRNWSPDSWEGIPSESMTAIEQICHVRDIEIDGYHVRLQRLLDEQAPDLASIDGYALATSRQYHAADPAHVFAVFRDARKKTLALVRGLTSSQWARSGTFAGYGRVTVLGLVHFLCSHDQQHLAGLQWLLGQIESNTVPGRAGTRKR